MKGGPREYDIPHKEKPCWKTDTKRQDKCCDMGLEGKEAKNQHMFFEDVIVAEEINENIQKSIGGTTGPIPESLQGHHFPERRIKIINKRIDPFFGHKR
jgi:hypothetical protein